MKQLINNTVTDISIDDTGVVLLASSTYTIPPTDHDLWAVSDDTIIAIAGGDVTVSDGTNILGIAEGIALLQSNSRITDLPESLKDSDRIRVTVFHENSSGGSDGKVKVSVNDLNSSFLEEKITGTANKITVTTLNDGGDEDIQIGLGAHVMDKSTDDTDDIIEGVSNLYFTNNRAKDAAGAAVVAGSHNAISVTYNDTTKVINIENIDKGSDAITTHEASGDPHNQYLLVSGTRQMSGSLDMGTNNITNVGMVDGVDVSVHASRHLPNGADPLTTGTPNSIGSANSEGVANAFARQDHVHAHGDQGRGTQHQVATTSEAGFMSSTDKTKLDGVETNATNYTDEKAQDAVGTILVDTSNIDFTYNDTTPSITADLTNTTVTPGTYGTAFAIPSFTVDAKGRLTAAGTNNISLDDYHYGSTTTISTTSTSYVTMTSATFTPVAGTYLVIGRGNFGATSNGRRVSMSVYLAGSVVAGTASSAYIRNGGSIFTTSDTATLVTTTTLTVNGSQAVDLRWSTSGGTAECNGYGFTLIRIA